MSECLIQIHNHFYPPDDIIHESRNLALDTPSDVWSATSNCEDGLEVDDEASEYTGTQSHVDDDEIATDYGDDDGWDARSEDSIAKSIDSSLINHPPTPTTSSTIDEISKSISNSDSEEYLSCKLCPGFLILRNQLDQHIMEVHSWTDSQRAHLINGWYWLTAAKINRPESSSSSRPNRCDEEKTLACPNCPKKFKTATSLANHICAGGKEFRKCPYCRVLHSFPTAFRIHLLTHNVSPFMCTLCGFLLSSKQELRRHHCASGVIAE